MEPIFAAVIKRLEAMHADYLKYMDGLTTEELDWSPGPDMNSLCVLAVHATAAERFWVGVAIDDISKRDRPAEFRAKGYEFSELEAALCLEYRFLHSTHSRHSQRAALAKTSMSVCYAIGLHSSVREAGLCSKLWLIQPSIWDMLV